MQKSLLDNFLEDDIFGRHRIHEVAIDPLMARESPRLNNS